MKPSNAIRLSGHVPTIFLNHFASNHSVIAKSVLKFEKAVQSQVYLKPITIFKSQMSVYSIAVSYLYFVFSKTRNKHFRLSGVCDEKDGLVALNVLHPANMFV